MNDSLATLSKFISVSTSDAENQRRGQLLNIVLIGMGLLGILLLFAILILVAISAERWPAFSSTFWTGIVFVPSLFGLYWLSRHGKVFVASTLFLIVLIFAITFADVEAMALGNTNFYFVIPILMASVLVRPLASFLFAAIISVVTIIAAVQLNFEPDYYFTSFGLFAIAFVSWLTSRNLENALKDLRVINLELDQRVADRTEELAGANVRLEQQANELAAANIQLLELDGRKSKFVADVSHELRTPISNLAIYLEMLREGSPDKRERYLAVLREETSRLENMVADVLDLSRMEEGITSSKFMWTNYNDIVEKVLTANQLSAEAKGLEMAFMPGSELPKVLVEVDLMTQALNNLIANAINYTPEGGVDISTKFDAGNNQIILSVADTGVGIALEDQQHIFDRFYRGTHAGQSTIPGTGLGLAITREIIEKHGGSIELQSELGSGSTFRIYIPVTNIEE